MGPVVLAFADGDAATEAEAVHPILVAACLIGAAGEVPVGPVIVLRVEGRLVRRRQREELAAHRLHVPHRLCRHAMVDHLLNFVVV